MRNPYIVGRWLRGTDHYGRSKLIEHLLTTRDQAIWLVGTRRMGKTSLLRQLEWLIEHNPTSQYVPLFWDLQACENAKDLAYELFISVEDETERFAALGIDILSLEEMDVNRILRTLQRTLKAQGKQLLLLIDEAEALVNVAKNDSRELARLRRSLQQGEYRTILTATKQLMELNELMRDWLTSPFLFGFNLVNLWSLDVDATRKLIQQAQNDAEVSVDPAVMEEVLVYTHRHPYLIQYLCHRLFEPGEDGTGHLRAVQPEDLQADHLLSGFLQMDYDHLSPTERQILLTIARHGVVDEVTIGAELNISSPSTVERFLYGMNKLGYLRQVLDAWVIGNEFLRRWILENYDSLARHLYSRVSDENVEALLLEGKRFELQYLQKEVGQLQQRMEDLVVRRNGYGNQVPLALADELQKTRQEIEAALVQIQLLSGDMSTAAKEAWPG